MISIFRMSLIFVSFLTCSNALLLLNSSVSSSANNSTKPVLLNNTSNHVENEQNNNVTDYCLSKKTMLERSECIQVLLEAYFGMHIAVSCPSLSLTFSVEECWGCPWNKITPDMVLNDTRSLPLPSSSFSTAKSSCNLANHVSSASYTGFGSLLEVCVNGAALVAIFTLTLTLLGASLKRTSIFGITIPESLYLGLLWVCYGLYIIFSGKAVLYQIKCDNINSSFDTWTSNYCVVITVYAVSLFRCFHLSTHATCNCCESSWVSFIASTFRNRKQRSRKSHLFATCFTLLPVLLIIDFLVEIFKYIEIGEYRSICYLGLSDDYTGYIQLSKIVLDTVCVVIYATKRSKIHWLRVMRYIALLTIFILNITVFGIMFTNHYNPAASTMLIPGLLDAYLAYHFVGCIHVFIVASLGLFEPLRIRLEKTRNCISGKNNGEEYPDQERDGRNSDTYPDL